jgi:hypothetical protein
MFRMSVCRNGWPDPCGKLTVAAPEEPVIVPVLGFGAAVFAITLPFRSVNVATHWRVWPVLLVMGELTGGHVLPCATQSSSWGATGMGRGNGMLYSVGFPMVTRRDEKKPPCSKKLSFDE